jgi:hypothetical protein
VSDKCCPGSISGQRTGARSARRVRWQRGSARPAYATSPPGGGRPGLLPRARPGRVRRLPRLERGRGSRPTAATVCRLTTRRDGRKESLRPRRTSVPTGLGHRICRRRAGSRACWGLPVERARHGGKPGYVHGRGRRGGPAVFEQQLGATVQAGPEDITVAGKPPFGPGRGLPCPGSDERPDTRR